MSLRALKEWFKSLQKGPLKELVAIVATIEQSLKYRSPVRIYVDQDGDWHNCRGEVTYVSPELNVTSWAKSQRAVMELWCYDYELKVGDTAIDIGAGIGDDTVSFSKMVGKEGCVIAIEAHPDTYRCLKKTVAANKLDNIICLNIAISDVDSVIEMSCENNFLSNSIMTGKGKGPVKVPARVLDHVMREINITSIDFIKMNIEGAEKTALLGMGDTLLKTPHVVISCHDFKADRGDDPIFRTFNDVNMMLRKALYHLRGGNKRCLPESSYYIYGKK